MAKSLKQSQVEEDCYGKYTGSFMLMHNRWVAPKWIPPGLKMKCQIISFRAVNLQFGPRRSTSFAAEACLDKKVKLKLGRFRSYPSFTFLQIPALFRPKNLIYLITKIQAITFGSGNRQGCPKKGGWPTCEFDSEPHLIVVGITARINCVALQILMHTNEFIPLDSQALTAPQNVIWEVWDLQSQT